MLPDRIGEIRIGEEVREIGITAIAVEVHEKGSADGKPRAFVDIGLNREVEDMLGFGASVRLHLVDVEGAVVVPGQHVRPGDGVVMEEARLEEYMLPASKRIDGFPKGRLPPERVFGNEDSSGESLSSQAAHLVSLREDSFPRRGWRREKVATISFEPESLGALQSDEVLGL